MKKRKTPPRPKWQRSGQRIRCISDFQKAVAEGAVVYVAYRFRGRPITIKWVANMSFGQVMRMIDAASIELAMPTARYMNWLRGNPEGEQA
jgi:hypothetical protein